MSTAVTETVGSPAACEVVPWPPADAGPATELRAVAVDVAGRDVLVAVEPIRRDGLSAPDGEDEPLFVSLRAVTTRLVDAGWRPELRVRGPFPRFVRTGYDRSA